MPTRNRKEWNRASNGQYQRQLGWKRSRTGKLTQAKFSLGTDTREAKQRDERLRLLWSLVEVRSSERPALWPSDALDVAKAIAKGKDFVEVDRKVCPGTKDGLEPPGSYASRIHGLQIHYHVMPFKPNDVKTYSLGLQENSLAADQFQQTNGMLESMKNYQMARLVGPQSPMTAPAGGPTLHDAMEAYIDWLEENYFDKVANHISSWGRTQVRQMRRLMTHHADLPLASLDYSATESLIAYWRKRRIKQGSNQPITYKTAGNHIKQIKSFLKWLHRTDGFDWRKPTDFDDIPTRVVKNAEDYQRQLTQVDTFSIDELVLLCKYATPFERLLVLLAVNCGFGNAEIASLSVDETHLHKKHDERAQAILGFVTSDHDSFIKRVRHKNKVYGEFILFPQTVLGLHWALEQRRRQSGFSPRARLLLNGKHEPFDKPSKSGNRNQQIPNAFARLLKRITDDGHSIRNLSFNKLRKTGGDLIRHAAGGEIAGVFLCHGQPVSTDNLLDVYTNRPFGKVFHAIQKVESQLQPVFEAAGPEPFQAGPQAYTPLSKVERIHSLRESGIKPKGIAEELGVSVSTVHRQLRKSKDC